MRRPNITVPQQLSLLVRGVIAVAISAAVLIAPVAATDASALSDRKRAKHTSVYVQGDSLTVGSGPAIRRKLRRSVKSVKIDASVGRHTSTGIARTRYASGSRASRVWVMALGTNDSPSASTMKRHVRSSLKAAGKRRDVVWLTIQRPGRYGQVNRMLRKYARSHSRLHVVDWAKHVKRNPWLLGSDRVHATYQGYEVRASKIAKKARRLARTG